MDTPHITDTPPSIITSTPEYLRVIRQYKLVSKANIHRRQLSTLVSDPIQDHRAPSPGSSPPTGRWTSSDWGPDHKTCLLGFRMAAPRRAVCSRDSRHTRRSLNSMATHSWITTLPEKIFSPASAVLKSWQPLTVSTGRKWSRSEALNFCDSLWLTGWVQPTTPQHLPEGPSSALSKADLNATCGVN